MARQPAISVIAGLLLTAVAQGSHAGVIFESSFYENWFDDNRDANNGDLIINGTTVATEYGPDILSLSLTSTEPSDPAVTLIDAFWQFDTGVFIDFVDGGPGSGDSAGLTLVSAVGFGTYGAGVNDGDTFLAVGGFAGGDGEFNTGDSLQFSLDLDDANSVIRGSNGSGSSTDFAGSTIDILYFDPSANFVRSASFTFGACEGAGSGGNDPIASECAVAGGVLEVPSPAPLALLGLGLAALGAQRRKARQKVSVL